MQSIEEVILALLGLIATYHIAFKGGIFNKTKLLCTPYKIPSDETKIEPFFYDRKKMIPVFGVINLLQYGSAKPCDIRLVIPFGVHNSGKHFVEGVKVLLYFEKRFWNEKCENWFMDKANMLKFGINASACIVDNDYVQLIIDIPFVYADERYGIEIPFLFSISQFRSKSKTENEYLSEIKRNDICFGKISFRITAKNIKKPIEGYFWVINTICPNGKAFFSRHKHIIAALIRDKTPKRKIFTFRRVNTFYGKCQKCNLLKENESKTFKAHIFFDKPFFADHWSFHVNESCD